MSLDAFCKTQEEVYSKLRLLTSEVANTGLRPEKNLSEKRGGFTVALKHPKVVSEGFSALSHHIARLVPSVAYDAQEIHTSLCSHGMRINFTHTPDDEEGVETLEMLREIVRCVCSRPRPQAIVEFGAAILTPEAVIAPGLPNQGFVELVYTLADEALSRGVRIQPAWGAHTTIARFKRAVPAADLQPLADLIRNTPPMGQSVAERIAVGYSLWSPSPETHRTAPEKIQGQFATHWECAAQGDST